MTARRGDRLLKASGLTEAGAGDELVVLHLESYRAIALNPTARAVWERCDGTRTEETLVSELTDAFDADPARIAADVRTLLHRLRSEGFLVDHASPSSS